MTRVHLAFRVFVGLVLASTLAAQAAGYPTIQQIEAQMQGVATAYPGIAAYVDLTTKYGTPTTHEGRHIVALKITDNAGVEEDEPTFLIVAAHHGNEVISPPHALEAIDRLVMGYGVDPRITAVVDSHEIWVIAVHNPDGYVNGTRKNRRNNGDGTFGVDLNRNYPQGWTLGCSGSTTTSSGNYKGPSPASEPETQTMLALSNDRRFAKVLDFHSGSGPETLHGYRCSTHPFGLWMEQEAAAVATAHGYAGLARGPSAEGEHYQWQFANFGSLSHLSEVWPSHTLPYVDAVTAAAAAWPGVLHMLERSISVFGNVTDASSGLPLDAKVELQGVVFNYGETNGSGGTFGRYNWTLPAGSYQIGFSAAGYQTQVVPAVVTATSAVNIDVALVPEPLSFVFPNGLPTALATDGTTTVRVEVQAGSRTPQAGTGMLRTQTSAGLVAASMTQVSPNVYDAVFPAFPCSEVVGYSFTADDSTSQTWTHPVSGAFSAGATQQTSVSHDFESTAGWTAGALGDTATTGIWGRMDPESTAAQPDDDHTPGLGTLCWVTDGLAGTGLGTYDVDGGFTTLLTPVFDLSGTPNAEISYWRLVSNNLGTYRDDEFRVEISANAGVDWVEVETLGPDGPETEGSWRQHSFLVRDVVTPSSQVQMRFVAEDVGNGSIVEAAIDDFAITVPACDVTGQSCTTGTCSTCPQMLATTSGGNPVSGNTNFALDLIHAPSNMTYAVLALSESPCLATGSNYIFCAPIHVRQPVSFLAVVPFTPGPAPCGSRVSVGAAVPVSPAFLGLAVGAQWAVSCDGSFLGTSISNCVSFVVTGS